MPEGPARLPALQSRRVLDVSKTTIQIGRLLYPEAVEHPRTRGECPEVRPCPLIGCRHNLWCDVKANGRVTVRDRDLEPWDAEDSCALDLAELGGMTLDEVGAVMSITRERVRQLEQSALAKIGVASLRALLP